MHYCYCLACSPGAKRKREEDQYDCVALPSVVERVCLVALDGQRFVVNDLIGEPLDEMIPVATAARAPSAV